MSISHQFDLAVVGGGIIGAWTVYLAVARFPKCRTVLIERSFIGSGATSRSAGVSLSVGQTPWQKDVIARSNALYGEAIGKLGLVPHPTNAFWIVGAPSEPTVARSLVGFDLSVPFADEHRRLTGAFPMLRVGSTEKILVGGRALAFDPAETARILVGHARQSEYLACWEGVEAAKILPCAEGVAIELSDGTSLTARTAIVAVGPWILESAAAAAIRHLRLRIKKVTALHIDRMPTADAPSLFLPDADAYLMPMPWRRHWLFSFRSEEWDCEPQSMDPRVNARDQSTAGAILDRYLPGITAACRGGRTFCDVYAPDGDPVVARHPEQNALIVAGGGAGSGFRWAPGLAETALGMAALPK